MRTADGQEVSIENFLEFLEGFAGGELASELTTVLGKAAGATLNHGAKSTFAVAFTVEPVDDSMLGEIVISHKITEKPARASRAGIYHVDVDSGQLSLG